MPPNCHTTGSAYKRPHEYPAVRRAAQNNERQRVVPHQRVALHKEEPDGAPEQSLPKEEICPP